MSKAIFPKRRVDGSFCVEVTLAVTTGDPQELLRRVKEWTSQWVEANGVWIRRWNTGAVEELRYEDEFERKPDIVFCNSTQMKIQLEGRQTSKWWRDWLVLRILHDLKDAFGEIQDVTEARDCDSVTAE